MSDLLSLKRATLRVNHKMANLCETWGFVTKEERETLEKYQRLTGKQYDQFTDTYLPLDDDDGSCFDCAMCQKCKKGGIG